MEAWVASDTPEGGQNWALGAGLRQTWEGPVLRSRARPGPPLPTLGLRTRASGLGSVPGRLLSSGKGLALVGSFLPARWGRGGGSGGPALTSPGLAG